MPLSQKDAAAKVTPLETKYQLSVGELKRFKEAAAQFTSDLAAFSRGKGWSDIEALLSQLHVRLRRSKPRHTPLRQRWSLLRQELDCHHELSWPCIAAAGDFPLGFSSYGLQGLSNECLVAEAH